MLGLLYIVLCMLTGYAVCTTYFPELKRIGEKCYNGKALGLRSLFAEIPAYYFSGTLLVTWFVYLTAYLVSVCNPGMEKPLLPANLLAFILFTILSLVLLVRNKKEKTVVNKAKISKVGLVLAALVLLLITSMMYRSFIVVDGELQVGYSVFSDFAVHLGMIRSFSLGNNFPTEYSHFAGEDIRYHFLFQFMVGNLEFLGMRLDHAFNIPSILSMFFACILLYVLALKISGRRPIGYLTVSFMLFRSSPSFFRFLAEIPKGEIWERLKTQTEHISYTPNEGWGLWNLKVYCNQRHLAFSLGVMFLALIFFMPYLYEMFDNLKQLRQKQLTQKEERSKRFRGFWECFLFNREAILPKNIRFAVFMGIFLGCTAFWNGAVLIACLSVLFVMALASSHRLDYLITALIAVTMSMLESKLFINGSAVSLQYYYGFIVENKTFWGVSQYMFELWGLLLILVVVYAVLGKGVKRYLVVAFSAPLLIALYISMTPDVTVNHKFIMIAAILLSLFPALIIDRMMQVKRIVVRIAAVSLIIIMTATGVFDYVVLRRLDENSLNYQLDDPLIEWVEKNSDSDDIWLTPTYSLHRVVLGGAMLYYGWPYYAWSAGYDTWGREEVVKQIYEAGDSETLESLIEENDIRFIVVDREVRTNTGYNAREDVIADTYQAVYTEGDGEWLFTIYDTQK